MNKLIIAGITICLLIGGLTAIFLAEDRTGPTITVNSTVMEYKQGDDVDTLLSYVSAIDEEDGDVSDSIMVANILPLLDESQAKVVYVAEDKSNNVTKKEVYVTYIPLMEEAKTIGDVNEENIDSNKASDEKSSGTVNVEGDDSKDSTGKLETSIEIPILTLADKEYTIQRRDNFEPKDMIDKISDDKDSINYLMDHVTVVGNYDVYTVGEYVLMYYVTDSDGNESERQFMVLKVE